MKIVQSASALTHKVRSWIDAFFSGSSEHYEISLQYSIIGDDSSASPGQRHAGTQALRGRLGAQRRLPAERTRGLPQPGRPCSQVSYHDEGPHVGLAGLLRLHPRSSLGHSPPAGLVAFLPEPTPHPVPSAPWIVCPRYQHPCPLHGNDSATRSPF